jgi:hypothetical protein
MGIANLISVMVPGKGKGLIANGLIVILWSFGGSYGSSPTASQRFALMHTAFSKKILPLINIYHNFLGLAPTSQSLRERMGMFGVCVNYLSPFKWTFEFQVRWDTESRAGQKRGGKGRG